MKYLIWYLVQLTAMVLGNPANPWVFDYEQKGADWGTLEAPPGLVNNCNSTTNQSPINLMDPIGSYGWAYGQPLPKEHDNSQRSYSDFNKPTPITWSTNSIVKIFIEDEVQGDSFFVSSYGKTVYGSETDKFVA